MAIAEIDGELFEAMPGEKLSELLIRTGKTVPMPCGGRGDCGKCRVTVNGRTVLACAYNVESDIKVLLPERETIVSPTGAEESQRPTEHSALALDIGTTTLALALISLDDNKIVRVVTRANPQRAFGADVINRIGYCMEHGPDLMHKAVISAVSEMLRELGSAVSETLYVAGNTTMLHLFFGIDPSPMGVFPYTPVFLEMKRADGKTLGLPGIKETVSLPGAAAFVGADLIAGLNFIGFPPKGKYRLLIDLGTNAEVILFSRHSMLCTAAAAGPCFEGADISCGMSASPGAIYAYSRGGYATIEDAPAVGLCGTGLVDVTATLREYGVIDESGYMEDDYELAPGVFLTPGDVRQYQLAKSAVCSAVQALLKKQRISLNDIDCLFISGGFAAKINIDNAVKTGLLPRELKEKCVAMGNTSLLGTAKYVSEKNDLSVFTNNAEYVDLSADPVFSELFIENMMFHE